MKLAMGSTRSSLASARRIVIKIGTNALTHSTGKFHREHFDALAAEIQHVAQSREVVVVSSGAVALGVEQLKLAKRPKDVVGKQACAAVGQSRLMFAWEKALAPRIVAQVLLTHADVQNRKRYLNARHALERLLEQSVIPIINENDTVAADEIRFGDNDALAGMVTGLLRAEALIILSDVEGLYDKNPREHRDAQLIETYDARAQRADVGGSSTTVGTGGMATKLAAALAATSRGAHCIIASGQDPATVREVCEGAVRGTFFPARTVTSSSRDAWISSAVRPRGALHLDAGATTALLEKKKSLLPSGIVRVDGTFAEGDPVDLLNPSGTVIARGLASYAADELRKIAGKRSNQFESILGFRGLDEAVHRDDLVLL